MKVIAKVDNQTFLAEITENEIFNILGFNNAYDAKEYGWTSDNIRIGLEVFIHPMFKQLQDLASKEKEAKKLAKELREMADYFDNEFDPLINSTVVNSKEKR